MKEVEEIKAEKREQIKTLRNEFWKLLAMNKELPAHMQFQRKVSLNDWFLFDWCYFWIKDYCFVGNNECREIPCPS